MLGEDPALGLLSCEVAACSKSEELRRCRRNESTYIIGFSPFEKFSSSSSSAAASFTTSYLHLLLWYQQRHVSNVNRFREYLYNIFRKFFFLQPSSPWLTPHIFFHWFNNLIMFKSCPGFASPVGKAYGAAMVSRGVAPLHKEVSFSLFERFFFSNVANHHILLETMMGTNINYFHILTHI